MSIHPLRTECDSRFSDGLCLQQLASETASLKWLEAKGHGLTSASPALYNLLANSQTGTRWICPIQISANDLVVWKKAANGFAGSTQRGLSLLFDPFVYACLLNVSAVQRNEDFKEYGVRQLGGYIQEKLGPIIAAARQKGVKQVSIAINSDGELTLAKDY